MQITFTVQHLNPSRPTIATALRDRIGREPTNAELCAEVRRILRDARA
jgi:hypothetical protein